MTNRYVDIFIPIVTIVVISFAVAYGLFKLLGSTAALSGSWYQLGGGIAGFTFVFWMLRSWYDRLASQRADDLAIEIARLNAAIIVREAGDDVAALNTAYSDVKYQLGDYFSRQDKRWVEVLLRELRTQTIRQARLQYPHLRQWQPEEAVVATVVEDLHMDEVQPPA